VEDQEFSFRLASQGCRMVFNPQAWVFHRHVASFSGYVRKKFKIGYWKILVLKRHPQKMLRDSHTPQTLKLEIPLAFGAGFCLVPVPWCAIPGVFFLALFLCLAAFEMRRLWAADFRMGLFSLAMLFLRSLALGSGMAWGLLRLRGRRLAG
jgi:GT2 family glycosyltransferase